MTTNFRNRLNALQAATDANGAFRRPFARAPPPLPPWTIDEHNNACFIRRAGPALASDDAEDGGKKMPRLWGHIRKAVGEIVGEIVSEVIALVVGWLVCITILAVAFGLGVSAAPHLGWEGNPDTFGLLSALTILWMYEHRNMTKKYERLRELTISETS